VRSELAMVAAEERGGGGWAKGEGRVQGGRCRLYNDFITPSEILLPSSTFSTFLTRHTAHTSAATIIDFD